LGSFFRSNRVLPLDLEAKAVIAETWDMSSVALVERLLEVTSTIDRSPPSLP
jgi:hypothetical protein